MPDGTEWIVQARDVLLRGANKDDDDPEWIEDRESGLRMRASGGYQLLEDHLVPNVIEMATIEDVVADPQWYARVVVGSVGPRVLELRYYCSDPDSHGVRQSDLRATEVRLLTEDLVGLFMIGIEVDEEAREVRLAPSTDDETFVAARRFAGRLGAGRSSRDITPQLLERVATIYRDNIDGYPTKAVQHHFQVSQRMAAEYVSRARKRGLLPPTKRGKKNA